MRQLLATLTKLLEAVVTDANGNRGPDTSVFVKPVARCIAHVFGYEDLSCVKPSMLVLDMFISKELISPTFLINQSLQTDSCHSKGADTGAGKSSQRSSREHVDYFISHILRWARHLDITPSARRLLVSFVKAALATNDFATSINCEHAAIPLWLPPVQRMIHEYPDTLETLERHILPDLLRLDPTATSRLVQEMPMEDILRGDTGEISVDEIRFCLLVSRILSEVHPDIDLGRHDRVSLPDST